MTSTNVLSTACHRLASHDETLTLLNVSCQGVGSQGVIKLCKSCCGDTMQQTTTTTKVSSDQQYQHPTDYSSPLVAIWLDGNDIYPSGAKAMRDLLRVSPRLKYLYMPSNYIGNAGVAVLAPKAFHQCEVCNLGDNKIDSVGAISIANVLASNNNQEEEEEEEQQNYYDIESKVKTLILDNNMLGNDGAVSIAESLKHNTTLKHLDLRYNKIGKDGIVAFRDVLKYGENMTVQQLLFEEEKEYKVDDGNNSTKASCTRAPPRRQVHRRKIRRLMEIQSCPCELCHIRYEIEYFLALNRVGRSYFGDTSVKANLWPRILAKASQHDEPALLYAMLKTRPDVALRR
jgi:hypothetical protein